MFPFHSSFQKICFTEWRRFTCTLCAQLCGTLGDSMDCSLPGSSAHGISQVRILEWVAISSSRGSSRPGIEPRSPALQADSLPAESQGKPKNTGVGSLSLLQGIFPTQGSNPGLPHCRQTLYQLSHQGSPDSLEPWPCDLCLESWDLSPLPLMRLHVSGPPAGMVEGLLQRLSLSTPRRF